MHNLDCPIERKDLSRVAFKMADEGRGYFDAIPSVMGEIDDGGDLIPRGAFATDLDEYQRTGVVCHSHDWSFATGTIGYPMSGREDGFNLRMRAAFHSTPDAQAVRTKMRERLAANKSVGLSIGYRPVTEPIYVYANNYAAELPQYINPARLKENLEKAQRFSRIRVLPRVSMREFSVVTSPMNRLAEAQNVKEWPRRDALELEAARLRERILQGQHAQLRASAWHQYRLWLIDVRRDAALARC